MEGVKVTVMLLLCAFLLHFTDCLPDIEIPAAVPVTGRRTKMYCILNETIPSHAFVAPDPDPKCSAHKCVSIMFCTLSNTSITEHLKEKDIHITSMKSLYLLIQPEPALSAQHLDGLSLENLTLEYYNYSEKIKYTSKLPYLTPDAYFLEPLQKLRIVNFTYVILPPLPLHSVVEEATFIHGASPGAFGGCQELRSLVLDQWEVHADYWLANCPKLTNLTILDLRGIAVKSLLHGAIHLKHLRLNSCHFGLDLTLDSLLDSYFIAEPSSLVTLNLNSNGLEYILSASLLSLPYLEELYLRDNNLQSLSDSIHISRAVYESDIMMMLKIMWFSPKLKVLDVSGNEEYNICKTFFPKDDTYPGEMTLAMAHPNLRRLILDRTDSTIDCITKEWFPALEYLSLVDNKFTHVSFQNLPEPKVPLTISFGGTPIRSVSLDKSTYARIYNRSKTDNKPPLRVVNVTSLDCDCANGYFMRALRVGVIDGEFITCEGDEEKYKDLLRQKNNSTQDAQQIILKQIEVSKLECDKYPCDGCVCRRSWRDSYVTANCSGSNITEIPQFNKTVRRLEAANNRIMNLSENAFPSTLEFADLSSNYIAHINKETTSSIFSKKIRLRLSNNPIACDCDNYYFLKSLQEHPDQVADYAYLSCLNERVKFLSEVNVGELCQTIIAIQASLAVGAAVLVLAIGALVIQHRYGRAIKIFVHARGWCACCVKEDMIDADKPYDVFVTFCHADTAVVVDEVVPKLESLGYRTCVHIRDWLPGEYILNQITRSVEASRRTMVFLSQNFLKSMWGMLEFRTAHTHAIEDGIPRLMMVLLEDVDDSAVEPDLRSFLRSNTYVRWDDPWFWDKIQYALPPPRAATQTNNHGIEAIEINASNCDNVLSASVESTGV